MFLCCSLSSSLIQKRVVVLDCKSFSHLFDLEIDEEKNVLDGGFMSSTGFTRNMILCLFGYIQLKTLEGMPTLIEIFKIDAAQYISKLIKISGITITASRTKAKATYVTLMCKNGRSTQRVPCQPGLGGAIVPRSCNHIPQAGEEPCPLDPWIVVPGKSMYVDQRTLKLQENPEDVPTGELPRNMLLSVDRHLVQTTVPGTRLTIMGIYSIYQAANSSASHKGAVAIRQPYIRVVGIEESN